MKEEFLRTAALIGDEALEKLGKSTVCVFGLGGVGSYSAEALVRAGIGKLYIYDNDKVSRSNINRQLIALDSTVGEYKTSVAARRYRDINKDCIVIEKCEFVTPQSEIPFEDFDFIIDAIDNVTAKLFLAEEAYKRQIPIISVMGTGNKTDPSKIKVTDIYKTSVCPLAKVMRYELKKREVKKLKVVWSDEEPKTSSLNEEGRPVIASISTVPSVAGLMAANEAIKALI